MTTTNAPASLHRSATQTRTAGCTELDQAPEPSSGSAFGLDQIGETTTLAVSYLRVSTKEQASKGGRDEGFSIPAQREANLRKAQGLNAIIIEEFVDAGESARKADRPALMELIEYVKTHPVAYCIVHKVDRLARNRADDVAIHLALKEAGVLLVSATENIDETPSGMLLHGIMSTIAEFYSRNLANEVSKGMTQKAITGGTNGKAPMGYLNVTRRDELGRELRTIEVDPHRGPLIRWAFEAYATGNYSTATLREELIDRGLTTVATPKRPARPPALSSIQRMLSSPYYKGNVLFKGATYDGLHEPLVAPEIWYRVQTVLAAHQVSGEKTQAHDHYLKGSVFCGICGSRLILTNAKSRRGVIYPYFICSGRHKKRTNCNRKAMFVPDVEAAVEDYYRTVQIPAHIIGPLRELIHAEFDRLHATAKTERKAQIAERDRLYDERHKLLQAHYAGAVPLDLLKSEQDRIGRQVAFLDSRIEASEVEYDQARAHLDDCLALAGDAHTIYMSLDDSLRRIANQAFFNRLVVTDGDVVEGEPGVPFNIFFDPGVQATALARQGEGGNEAGKTGNVGGLNNDALVARDGVEPSTFRFSGRRDGAGQTGCSGPRAIWRAIDAIRTTSAADTPGLNEPSGCGLALGWPVPQGDSALQRSFVKVRAALMPTVHPLRSRHQWAHHARAVSATRVAASIGTRSDWTVYEPFSRCRARRTRRSQ